MQQARNPAMDLGDRIDTLRFLIHDRDPLFTTALAVVFRADGLRVITTLPRMPRMNAICERVIGTLRRELLDRTLILGERDLAMVLREYLVHYNRHWPHQSRQQRPPDIQTQPIQDTAEPIDLRRIRRKRLVMGLISEYHHAAWPQFRPRDPTIERHRVPQGITTTADAAAEAGYDRVRAIVIGWYYDQGGTERGVQLSFVDYSTPGAATCSADFADTPPYSSRSRACRHGREM
ncbi:integrase core domain-containing protein [Spirillospora sp. NBC_01491]|uniref:integrase core domain-containing protein n=1 Tax=Spirillospora sp. NBC_01491 TaxID=2976007 RepID=UPI002E2FDC43|nr:integrase core domain-containing protein [Spirillospora sp. NBC_01491]